MCSPLLNSPTLTKLEGGEEEVHDEEKITPQKAPTP